MNNRAFPVINYCRDCYKIPLINLVKNRNEILVNSFCSRCCQNKQFPLSTFVSNNVKSVEEQTEILNKIKESAFCKNHQKFYTYYCGECKIHCCENCNLNKHNTHWNIQLSSSIGEQSITNFGENIQKAESYINNDLRMIKEAIIKKLLQQIQEIENAYNEMQKLNMDIISLLKHLFTNCFLNIPSYNTIINVKNNINFNTPSYINIPQGNETNFVNFLEKIKILPISSIVEKPELKTLNFIKSITTPSDLHSPNTICALSDGRFAISNDKIINFYDNTKYFNVDFVYPLRNPIYKIIHFIHIENSKIVIIGKENEIEVIKFNTKSYQPLHKLNNNYNKIYLCSLPFNRFAYLENGTTVQINEVPIQPFTITITKNKEIYGMANLRKARLFVIKNETTLSFYKNNNFLLEKTVELKNARISTYESIIEFGQNKIIFATHHHNNKIIVLDTLSFQIETIISINFFMKQGKLVEKFFSNACSICCFEIVNENYILMGTNSGGLALFDIIQMTITETASHYTKKNKKGLFDGVFKKEIFHSDYISAIKQIGINRILTTSMDGSSKIWEW